MDRESPGRAPLVVEPGGGRAYEMGPMRAVFLADGAETAERYCVSEWWVRPGEDGPGAHSHEDNDELFYVLHGTMSFRVGEAWRDCPAGTFLYLPAGTVHDFANRTGEEAGVLNVFVPGGFEPMMPAIVDWFRRNRP